MTLVHYEGVQDQILSHEKLVRIVRVQSCTEPGAPTSAKRNLLLAAINLLFVTEYLFSFLKVKKFLQIAANVNVKTVPSA